MAQSYPYKLARLVHHNFDLSKRWYVIFWAWDASKDKLARKRLFEPLNRKKTIADRMYLAEYMIRTVNAQLRDGKILGKEDMISVKTEIMKMTLIEGVQYVINQKKLARLRKNSIRGLERIKRSLEAWLKHNNFPDFPVKKLNDDHVFSYFDYLQKVRKVENTTYNNYRDDLITIINFLMKRSPNLFKHHPIRNIIDILPSEAKKHAAFSDEQIKAIINEARTRRKSDQFILMVQMIYYTLARPNELLQLRVSDVDMENNRILFRAGISKNKRDEYVTISSQLKDILITSKVLESPAHYFIFGKNQKPGTAHPYDNAFWERNSNILKKLEYTEREYSLYSYKHSGAISLYLATKDIKMVQRQCRHRSIKQTDEYLRDLHLLDDNEAVLKWKGAI